MNFEHSQKTKDLIVKVSNFIDQKIKPKEAAYTQAMSSFRESVIHGKFRKYYMNSKQKQKQKVCGIFP